MIGADRNADFIAVTRTTSTVTVHAPPAVREITGEFSRNANCPLCRTPTALFASVDRVEGRCTRCTVIVRLVDGKVKACGWMGGGDMRKAGDVLRGIRSRLEADTPTRRRPAKTPKPRKVAPCPSDAAWQRHIRNGENPCPGCEVAHREAENERRRIRRARQAEVAA